MYTILIIEDEPRVASLLMNGLEENGFFRQLESVHLRQNNIRYNQIERMCLKKPQPH